MIGLNHVKKTNLIIQISRALHRDRLGQKKAKDTRTAMQMLRNCVKRIHHSITPLLESTTVSLMDF